MIDFQNKMPAADGMEQFEFPIQVGLITSNSCRGRKSTDKQIPNCCQIQNKEEENSALTDRLIETYPAIAAFECLRY